MDMSVEIFDAVPVLDNATGDKLAGVLTDVAACAADLIEEGCAEESFDEISPGQLIEDTAALMPLAAADGGLPALRDELVCWLGLATLVVMSLDRRIAAGVSAALPLGGATGGMQS